MNEFSFFLLQLCICFCVISIWRQIHGKSLSLTDGALCVNICVLHNVSTQYTLSEKVDKGYQDVFIYFHQGICLWQIFFGVNNSNKDIYL